MLHYNWHMYLQSDQYWCKVLFCLVLLIQSISLCLSSYGQNLTTSTFIGETSFAILIAIVGLVLFAHLIGNMQVCYLVYDQNIICVF